MPARQQARGIAVLALGAAGLLGLACPNPDDLRVSSSGSGGSTAGTGGSTGGAGGAGGAGGMGGSSTGGATGTGGTTSGGAGGRGGTGGGAPAGGTGGAGTGGTGGAGGSGGETHEQACTRFGNALAAAFFRCSPFIVQFSYGSQAAHAERLKLDCTLRDLPGINFPPRPFDACLMAIANRGCADLFNDGLPAACQAPGQGADGTSCTAGDQCRSLWCLLPANGGCGQCGRPPAAGEPCFMGVCPPGLTCTERSQVCIRPAGRGTPCDSDRPCQATLACLNGVCGDRLPAGADCSPADECNLFGGVVCSPDGLCTQVTVGPTCGFVGGGVQFCAASGFCRQQTCTPPGRNNGDACNTTTGPLCLWPAECTGATCQLPAYNPTCTNAAGPLPGRVLPLGGGAAGARALPGGRRPGAAWR
jgi:hypothetical protein